MRSRFHQQGRPNCATVAALTGEREPHRRWETQPNCLCPAPTSLLLTSWDFSPFPPKTEYQLLNLWFCCIAGRFVLCKFHIREYGWTRIPEKAREYHDIMPTRQSTDAQLGTRAVLGGSSNHLAPWCGFLQVSSCCCSFSICKGRSNGPAPLVKHFEIQSQKVLHHRTVLLSNTFM